MCSKESEIVEYGVVIPGGVQVLNEVNEVGGYVVIGKNFRESVVGNGVESLVQFEVEVADVGVEGEIGNRGEDVVDGSVVG